MRDPTDIPSTQPSREEKPKEEGLVGVRLQTPPRGAHVMSGCGRVVGPLCHSPRDIVLRGLATSRSWEPRLRAGISVKR